MKKFLGFVAAIFLVTGCMDQYNPVPYWKQFTAERQITSAPQSKLTEKGEMPVVATSTAAADPASEKYASLCSSCHGAEGKADSAAAGAMNPKPRNFQDKDWQAKVDDARIAKAIKDGGAAVGLAGTMPPWGAVLSDEDINLMVAKIRAWGK